MNDQIPIIDIFAGPGGLGEGFSASKSNKGYPQFKIKLSIEKDVFAHRTLELRAFFRQFADKNIPNDYYEYLRGNITRQELFGKYPNETFKAKSEAWLAELGVIPNDIVDSRIKDALMGFPKWALIGGPPCQAYSLVGRSRIRGANGEEKYQKDPRHFLYKEYLRILAVHQPPVFVMENVKGLLSAQVGLQKTFDLILTDLQNPLNAVDKNSGLLLSYNLFSISKKRQENHNETKPEDFIVHSEDYGIPQSRHRIIIFGIRSDVYKYAPEILKKKDRVSIDNVIGDLPKLRSGLSKEADSEKNWRNEIKKIAEKDWLESLPEDLKKAIISESKNIGVNLTRGSSFIPLICRPKKHQKWFIDNELKGVCNHESRSHINEDLQRYFFASVYAKQHGRSPMLKNFPEKLLPNHKNVQEAINSSKFNDRFRVQVQGKPSTTVVSHISKDGHYYIHYDPAQCRSLTVREAARLQTFPDNYFFEGNKTQQYHQVGNAVPPLLAHQIAHIVANILNNSTIN